MAALTIIAIVVSLAWWASLWLWPWKRCPACKGTKRVHGFGGFRICTRCDKDGKVRRIGAGKAE